MKVADECLTAVRRNDWYKLKIDEERQSSIAPWAIYKEGKINLSLLFRSFVYLVTPMTAPGQQPTYVLNFQSEMLLPFWFVCMFR